MTRVLLDTSPLAGCAAGRGVGRYVTALDAALRTFATVETYRVPARSGRLAELRELPARQGAQRRPHDVLVTPTAYHAPVRSRRPWVASILDLIPLDMAAHRRTGAKAQLFHRLSARADVVLTLSQHGAGRIHELLGVPHERIVVAPLPVAPTLVPGRLPEGLEPGGYVLALVDLASPDPRKRAHWLIDVARQLDVPLVAAGAGTAGALPGVRGLGRVDDATWAALLRDAAVFVYTSAYEGQGLPPLEAMAAGVPVVAMDNTAVREFVGDAGFLVPECDDGVEARASLAEACRQLFADQELASKFRSLARQRAAAFTPQAFEAQVEHAVRLAT